MPTSIGCSIFMSVIACIFHIKEYNKSEKTNPLKDARCCMMINKYIKYLPYIILGALSSYLLATDYARNSFDLFYLTLNFMIVNIAILVFYENVLRDKCKELFIRIMSNPKKISKDKS